MPLETKKPTPLLNASNRAGALEFGYLHETRHETLITFLRPSSDFSILVMEVAVVRALKLELIHNSDSSY